MKIDTCENWDQIIFLDLQCLLQKSKLSNYELDLTSLLGNFLNF